MSLLDFLENYKDTVMPMHMPGHKRNTSLAPYLERLCADIDVTEAEGLDNLHKAEGILLEEMKKTSELWGSRRAFWLVNGSTSGILSAIRAQVPKGSTVICARNCHKSVYNGLLLAEARPVFIMPEAVDGILGAVSPREIEKALEEHRDACLVIVTSPTYEGVISDLPEICRVAHKRGVPVLLDEAHGAHLGFSFPEGGISAGADIVVHSLHKTLPSLTQTAVLHINGELVDEKRVAESLAIFQTSSPSYLLMASISGCIELIKNRPDLFTSWRDNLSEFYKKTENLKNLFVIKGEDRDPSKIVVSTKRAGINGSELSRLLREKGIEPEMSSLSYVLLMTGLGDTEKNLERLASALFEIDNSLKEQNPVPDLQLKIPKRAMYAYEADFIEKSQKPLDSAVGCVSGEMVWAYPPGIPLIIQGEKITPELIELIKKYEAQGVNIESTTDGLPDNICVLWQ